MKYFHHYHVLSYLQNIGRKIIPASRNKGLVFLLLTWISFWTTPWARWLDSLPWVRLGISLLAFVMPGLMISILLAGARFSLLRHFNSGLAFSVLFVSVLGLLGRLFHMPFEFIKLAFVLIGLIALFMLFRSSSFEDQLYKPKSFSRATLFFLVLLITFGIVINLLSRTTGDDQTYLAYLTSWQHAQPLNFQEVYFGSGNIDSIRFWLALFPMSLALLAEMSKLHGLLLIGFYLEPFLIVIAILTTYDLYEHLLQSQQQVIAALLLQFTFLFLLRGYQQPGLTFFNRLSEDKVFAAFILFPVFFLSTCFLLEHFNLRSVIFFLLSGFSLTLTHPVILAFSTFIIGVHVGIVTILGREYKKAAIMVFLLAIIILPVGLLRFIEVSSSSSIPYDLESALEIGAGIETRISYLAGTPFYGLNLERIQILNNDHASLLRSLLSYSYLWILGLGFLWSIFNIKRNNLAPFIAATSSLTLFSAIPYTGWIIGYFVSARMLWRVPWLLPIGLIGVVLLSEFFRLIFHKVSINALSKFSPEKVTYASVIGISSILIVFFSAFVYGTDWKALTESNSYHNTLENLAALGNYFEANIAQPSIFVAAAQSSNYLPGLFTQSMMDYLPGLSSKSKVVFFRGYQAPYPVEIDKLSLIFSSTTTVSVNQRINILKRNHIQYILLDNHSIMEYYASKSQFFDLHTFGSYGILKLRQSAP